ncbi:hypothetical protein WDV06_29685 [Streptomyces racemochromogenes]|uniref:Uncharacterized protein n=1 Tax=Streptomyces racemochromogenes TaxID=67353 RepID=A0ABW7PLF6_9ACTN
MRLWARPQGRDRRLPRRIAARDSAPARRLLPVAGEAAERTRLRCAAVAPPWPWDGAACAVPWCWWPSYEPTAAPRR